ncbi:MAG: YihY/virulence factor BrkB family protein [Armatimonadia bacterium]
MKRIVEIIKTAAMEFVADEAVVHAAAVAFFTVLSLSPLVIILLSAAGRIDPAAQRDFVRKIEQAAGPQVSQTIGTILQNVNTDRNVAATSSIFGWVVLLTAATAVFVQLQSALNKIWDVRPKPGLNVWTWARQRGATFLMVLILGGLMLAAVLFSWILRAVLPAHMVWVGTAETILELAFLIALFAMVFKFLPDTKIGWSDVWIGATITGVLFAAGRYGIGLYLTYSHIASAYGAAGSLVLLLLLVYYSALIVFFGAELTQVYARLYGRRIEPAEYAEYVEQPSVQPSGPQRPAHEGV